MSLTCSDRKPRPSIRLTAVSASLKWKPAMSISCCPSRFAGFRTSAANSSINQHQAASILQQQAVANDHRIPRNQKWPAIDVVNCDHRFVCSVPARSVLNVTRPCLSGAVRASYRFSPLVAARSRQDVGLDSSISIVSHAGASTTSMRRSRLSWRAPWRRLSASRIARAASVGRLCRTDWSSTFRGDI